MNSFLQASLNDTTKTQVSTATLERGLQDAGLAGRVAKKRLYLRLANYRELLRWTRINRHRTVVDWRKSVMSRGVVV